MEYTLGEEATIEALGLLPFRSAEQIIDMVVRSARVTHPHGNRRYKDFVFDVQGGTIRHISRFRIGIHTETLHDCPTCSNTRKITVYDECETTGELIRKEIPCQICSRK